MLFCFFTSLSWKNVAPVILYITAMGKENFIPQIIRLPFIETGTRKYSR